MNFKYKPYIVVICVGLLCMTSELHLLGSSIKLNAPMLDGSMFRCIFKSYGSSAKVYTTLGQPRTINNRGETNVRK